MKSIFYCSNAHEEIYNNNTRSNFNSYIDIHHIEYLHHDDEIEAAIKSITFDEKTTVAIHKKYTKPNIVIKHEIDSIQYHIIKQYYEDIGGLKQIFSTPDLSKSIDYVILDDGIGNLVIYEEEENKSNFCNLQIVTSTYVMHNLFLHDVDIFSETELIHYLNNTLKSVSLSSTRLTRMSKDLLEMSKDGTTYLKSVEYDIYIEGELGNILNLGSISVKVHSGKSLKDIFRWIKVKKITDFFANKYISAVLNHQQEIQYYKVRKRMKSKKINMKSFKNEKSYGIKSNISDSIVRNAGYDNIISLFVGNRSNDVIHVEFKNPTFLSTRTELLSRASFQIIEVDTDTTPHFAVGSPTYIQVVVRKRIMGKKFNIFLDSSCEKSKTIYPENTATSFTIELPERLTFNKHWQVTMKSLFLSNNIHNVSNCWMMYYQSTEGKGTKYKDGYKVLHSVKLALKEGNYSTIDSVLNDLSKQMLNAKLPISIQEQEGKVKIRCKTFIQSETFLEIELSQDLASILGFIKPPERFRIIKLNEYQEKIAPYEADVFITYPKNLIIGCDVVDNTIFGGEYVKLLKMVTNTEHSSSNILTFEFLQNEYIDLNVKEFKSIQIAIMDVTGNSVKTDNSTPTRLQLMFSTV